MTQSSKPVRKPAGESTPDDARIAKTPSTRRVMKAGLAAANDAEKPVALTVKVDQSRYEALKVLGARTRRNNQQILLSALDAYLHGGGEDGSTSERANGGTRDEFPQ